MGDFSVGEVIDIAQTDVLGPSGGSFSCLIPLPAPLNPPRSCPTSFALYTYLVSKAAFARLLFGVKRLRITTEEHFDPSGENDSQSLIGSIAAGLTDFSLSELARDPSRDALATFIGPVVQDRLGAAHIRGLFDEPATLRLQSLLPVDIIAPMGIFLLLSRLRMMKVFKGLRLFVLFSFGSKLFLNSWRGYVVKFFNTATHMRRLRTESDLLEALKREEVKIVVTSHLKMKQATLAQENSFQRELSEAIKASGVIVNDRDAVDQVGNGREKKVLVADYGAMLEVFPNYYCKPSIFPLSSYSSHWMGLYSRFPNDSLVFQRLTKNLALVRVMEEGESRRRKMAPLHCYQKERSQSLSLHQVSVVFSTGGLVSLLGAGIVAVEKTWRYREFP